MQTLGVLLGAFGGSALAVLIVSYLSRQLVEQQLRKDLEVFRSGLNEQLEGVRQNLALDRERYSKDYALFATRRNEVYAETYAAFERARGEFSRHFGSGIRTPDFRDASIADMREILAKLTRLYPAERMQVSVHLDAGAVEDARTAMYAAAQKAALRDANACFDEFRNTVVVQGLYFDAEVEQLLEDALNVLRTLDGYADRRLADLKARSAREGVAEMEQVHDLSERLRKRMREEMQKSFTVAQDAGAP